jgi:hypothetical protein
VVKLALTFALEHSVDTSKWVLPGYNAGLSGYDAWIAALGQGRTDALGISFNTAAWKECRGFAALFLEEAGGRLGGLAASPLASAATSYQTVFDQLSIVADLFPFKGMHPGHVREPKRVQTAITALKAASSAEAQGLEHLRSVVAEL